VTVWITRAIVSLLHECCLAAFWLAVLGILAAIASILIAPSTLGAAGSALLVLVGVALAAMVASAALPGEPVHIPLLR
jgi:membrane protein implicated in regulation of membrane protease activity